MTWQAWVYLIGFPGGVGLIGLVLDRLVYGNWIFRRR